MRKTIEVLGDRLLSMFVPKADVGAACAPDPYYKSCGCAERSKLRQYCSTNAACVTKCGACVAYALCV